MSPIFLMCVQPAESSCSCQPTRLDRTHARMSNALFLQARVLDVLIVSHDAVARVDVR